jgi:hypothetical protein
MNLLKIKKEQPQLIKKDFKVVSQFSSFDEKLLFFLKIKNKLIKNSKLLFKQYPIEIYENVKLDFIYTKKQKEILKNTNEINLTKKLNKLYESKIIQHIPYTFKISKHKKHIISFQEFFSFNLYTLLVEYPIANSYFLDNILFIIDVVIKENILLKKYNIFHNDLHLKNILVNESKNSLDVAISDWEYGEIGIKDQTLINFYKRYFPLFTMNNISNIERFKLNTHFIDLYKFLGSLKYTFSLNLYKSTVSIYSIIEKYHDLIGEILISDKKYKLKKISNEMLDILYLEIKWIKSFTFDY